MALTKDVVNSFQHIENNNNIPSKSPRHASTEHATNFNSLIDKLESHVTVSTSGKPRCAPVREAVDPAKYVSITEGDCVKFACSKCGNVYKWKKSLNKHWKEKHDGEVPRGPPAVPRQQVSLASSSTAAPPQKPPPLPAIRVTASPPQPVQQMAVGRLPKPTPVPCYHPQSPLNGVRVQPPPAHIKHQSPRRGSCESTDSGAIDLSRPLTPQTDPLDLCVKRRDPNVRCEQCGHGFLSLDGLNQHFLLDHGVSLSAYLPPSSGSFAHLSAGLFPTLVTEKPGVLYCLVCGSTFLWLWAMQRHFEESHHGLFNPYSRRENGCCVDRDTSDCETSRACHESGDRARSESFEGTGDESPSTKWDSNTAVIYPEAPEETRRRNSGRSTTSVDAILPYKCHVCEYRARWPSEITQHMKNHSDEKPFACPRCSYRSKWKWDVVKHLKRCGGGTVRDVIDTTKLDYYRSGSPSNRDQDSGSPQDGYSAYRDRDYEDPESPADHGSPRSDTVLGASFAILARRELEREHGGNLTVNGCSDDRPYSGKIKSELSQHYRSHSKMAPHTGRPKWSCNRCPFHTNDLPSFLQHRKSHVNQHDGSEDEATNRRPVKQEPRESEMKDEFALLPGTSEGKKTRRRLKKCRRCGYVTDNVTTLTRHLMKHGKDGKFRCRHCDYSVDKEHVMEYHTSLVHGPRGANAVEEVTVGRRTVFKCRQCGYSDHRLESINNHVSKHREIDGHSSGAVYTADDLSLDVDVARGCVKASPDHEADDESDGDDMTADGTSSEEDEVNVDCDGSDVEVGQENPPIYSSGTLEIDTDVP